MIAHSQRGDHRRQNENKDHRTLLLHERFDAWLELQLAAKGFCVREPALMRGTLGEF
jgi:hypothetical protein